MRAAPGSGDRGPSLGAEGVLALLVLGLGGVGYAGYALYPRFGLPAADGATLLTLAAAAGVASFFSPCVFGLLVSLLVGRGGRSDAPEGHRGPGMRDALSFATGFSLGASVFVLATGAVIGLGGAGLVAGVTFTSAAGRGLRLAVGVLLALLGLVQLGLLPSPFHRVAAWVLPLRRHSAQQRRRRPLWAHAVFGFVYLLAGFG